jgi:hypothetical protein
VVKAAPAPISAAAVAQPPAEADPLAPLRPHLAEALSKVRTAAGPLGLLGWPGVAAPDGSDAPNPTPEDRFFHNDRALVFVDKATGRYSALALMPESRSTEELHYWLVWVRDLFGSPVLGKANPEAYEAGDSIDWRGSETVIQDRAPTGSGIRLYPDEAFLLLVGPRESDNTTLFLANATPHFSQWVQKLLDDHGSLEGVHGPEDAEFVQTLTRKAFQAAIKRGESKRFVWFEVDGKPYAAEKADWEVWVKGPRPSVIKDTTP